MNLVDLIVESAGALQMDPLDLATIISYETAGTFDPTKAGPTTQWGQHKGLIQFGEPQAREYGVDWNNPLGSQLGANGAVVRYFQQNGWRPGMGLLDAYSIVNAGGPGRYNASDANNGGAPGTVRDKVTGQMDGHRAKAASLLGREWTPTMNPGPALSFGSSVPSGPPDMSALPLSMGTPVSPLAGMMAGRQKAQEKRQEEARTDQQRRLGLASLIV